MHVSICISSSSVLTQNQLFLSSCREDGRARSRSVQLMFTEFAEQVQGARRGWGSGDRLLGGCCWSVVRSLVSSGQLVDGVLGVGWWVVVWWLGVGGLVVGG